MIILNASKTQNALCSADLHGVAALLSGSSGLRLHRLGISLRCLVGGLACLHLPESSSSSPPPREQETWPLRKRQDALRSQSMTVMNSAGHHPIPSLDLHTSSELSHPYVIFQRMTLPGVTSVAIFPAGDGYGSFCANSEGNVFFSFLPSEAGELVQVRAEGLECSTAASTRSDQDDYLAC